MNIITQRNTKLSLKQARQKAKLNQEEMAKYLGISKKTYIQYEKYRQYFRADDMNKISEITNIPVEDIIFFVD